MKQTWLGILMLGSALGGACGGDGAKVVEPVRGRTGGDGTGGGNSDQDSGPVLDGAGGLSEAAAMFPNDKTGPEVVFKQPSAAAGQVPIVGGTVEVIVSLEDAEAGVSAKTLFASIIKSKTDVVRLEPVARGDDFVFTFEAADFEARADLNMTVEVEDRVGNVTIAPLLMQLDTKSPWVSLDPPEVRFFSLVKEVPVCSGNFDPIGNTPKDGEVVLQERTFRAFVWERAIAVPGQKELYYAGVNEKRVQLLVQDDPTLPLLTDGPDTDKLCDAVSDGMTASVRLDPIRSGGTPRIGDGTDGNDPTFSEACVSLTESKPTDSVKTLCNGTSDMTYVPTHDVPGGAAVVFGVGTEASGVGCTGTSWDAQTKAGWNCVVARAWDKAAPDGVGNLGFSKPIRVCRKLKATDCEGAAAGEILTPPKTLTCTDGCTLPPEVKEWGHDPFVTKN